LELTDALLPALQSILEVFSDLFDTKQDWTALFEVIKFGIRSIATVIYATIKLVDQLIKAVVYSVDAVGKALKGDFAGAGRAISQGVGAGLEQAKRDFEQIGKLWTESASPGTGRRMGGRGMELDTSAADDRAAAAARKAASDAKRAADEQQRLAERRNDLTQKAIELQEQLRRSVEDARVATVGVGASPTEQLFIERSDALTENERRVKDLTKTVVELNREVAAAGGTLDIKPFADLIDQGFAAAEGLIDKQYTQGLIDLLPKLEEYDAKIAEVTRGKTELTELEKLNAEVNLLQLDILAQTNPALAEQIRLLRERAGALDAAVKKQEESNKSFGTQFKEGFKQASDSALNLGANLASIATNGIDGLTNAIVDFASTGKAAFKEFAASVLKDLSAMLIKFAIFKAIGGIFPGLNLGFAATGGATGSTSAAPLKFATGGVMPSNVVPMRRYAQGGIARSPEMAIYGERGPEAYVPLPDGRSIPVKMKQRTEALNRYRPMGATGTMAADGEGGATGAMAVGTTSIDVRYTVERINDVEYVTADQFRQGMQQAAAEGAQRGQQLTLRRLQQSPATRRRVGV
jgi:phage-related minor tail protein